MVSRSWWMLGFVGFVVTGPIQGQVDYRNLDDGRPTRVEDATGVELFAFELLWSYGFEQEKGGEVRHLAVPELSYGLIPNLHIGLKVPFGIRRTAGVRELGLAGIEMFGFYSLSREGPILPALSVRMDGTVPVGNVGSDEPSVAFKAVATRSFGLTRAHFNASVRLDLDQKADPAESPEQWWAGIAVDRTLFRESLLLIGETWVERYRGREGVALSAGAGMRWQWTPTVVLDIGISRGFARDFGTELDFHLGFSYLFGIRSTMLRSRSEVL